MADKTPVRVVFNASNVATGMAEFQTGETIAITHGGTGLTAVGSAGQVLKVNAAGTALEFGAEGDISITNLVAPTNSDLTLTTSGTGNIVLDAITIRGTTITSADSSIININEGVVVDGTLNTSGQATLSGLAYPTSDGTVGQFLKTDGSGTLAFADLSLGDLTIIGSTISVPSNADFTLDPSGTGAIKLNANTDVTGNLTVTGTLDLGDSNFTNVGSLQLDSIAGDGDTNTSITFSGSDVITIATGGSTALTVNADQTVTLGTNKAIQFVDANESVSSDGTNLIFTSGGTAFKMPTTDGNDGDVLKTDGAGTLSFASSTSTASDDTRVVTKNNKAVGTSARTVDYFQSSGADVAWYFMALTDLTNDHSSASCFTVAHNNSDSFISGARGGASGSDNSLPTTSADISSSQVRVKIVAPSADSKISYYKIPLSRANTANETAGVTITTANTDVDSASESIDTFAHASFRAAKYLIVIDDNAKTETGVTEALVVHDGTNAFVTQYGTLQSGNNDMVTLSAAISGDNVVLSAAGLTPNLSLKIHKTLLADSMTAVSNANQKIIGATTVSSTATAFDNFDLDDATAAMYYVVGKNATEGVYSVQEVYCAGAPGEASVSQGPFVSTKETTQLEFSASFKSDADNSLELSISSTSGGSTVVNAYRINCLAE